MRSDEVVIPIFFFASIAVTLILWLTQRHRERMTMIEKGLSSEEIKALYTRGEIRRNPLSSLKWGILFVLAGLAVLVGNFLHRQYDVEDSVVLGMVILFIGIGLVIFYMIAGKKSDPASQETGTSR